VGVVLLTMLTDDGHVLEALQDGAKGFVLKTQPRRICCKRSASYNGLAVLHSQAVA
jgi:DNA-binding NarL/FixJ family response regulator